jgi:hypothetical protein
MSYIEGSAVTLSQFPSSTSVFAGWSACGTDPCSVTMNAARDVTATFNAAPVAVNFSTGTPYSSLSTALTNAESGNEVRVLDTQLVGPFTLSTDIWLRGGWNTFYTAQSGLTPTTLMGDLMIQSGNSTVETVVVAGNIIIQGGRLLIHVVTVQP